MPVTFTANVHEVLCASVAPRQADDVRALRRRNRSAAARASKTVRRGNHQARRQRVTKADAGQRCRGVVVLNGEGQASGAVQRNAGRTERLDDYRRRNHRDGSVGSVTRAAFGRGHLDAVVLYARRCALSHSTETVQDALEARVPPERLTLPDPATAVAVPPQVLFNALGVATTSPAGRLSVNAIPFSASVVFGF